MIYPFNKARAKRNVGVSYLGNINSSPKMIKNKKVSNQYTYIIYLAPAEISGYNVCSHSTVDCRMGCLFTSGRVKMETGELKTITTARIKKTKLFFENQKYFMAWMMAEIRSYKAKAVKDGYGFSVRLNGTSDIDWANVRISTGENIFELFPDVQFYDYTKNPSKFNDQPINYHLTFSYSGRNGDIATRLLGKGQNVAVVFNIKKGVKLPKKFAGYKVIDGDLTDYRLNDGNGVIVGLRFKEIASKADAETTKKSIFVINPETQSTL